MILQYNGPNHSTKGHTCHNQTITSICFSLGRSVTLLFMLFGSDLRTDLYDSFYRTPEKPILYSSILNDSGISYTVTMAFYFSASSSTARKALGRVWMDERILC